MTGSLQLANLHFKSARSICESFAGLVQVQDLLDSLETKEAIAFMNTKLEVIRERFQAFSHLTIHDFY